MYLKVGHGLGPTKLIDQGHLRSQFQPVVLCTGGRPPATYLEVGYPVQYDATIGRYHTCNSWNMLLSICTALIPKAVLFVGCPGLV